MYKRISTVFAMALVALLLVIQPALAAAPKSSAQPSKAYGLNCVEGVCRLQLDLGADVLPQGAWLTVLQSALRQLPGGLGIEVNDDVTITLPTGTLALVDADLVMTVDATGKVETLRGSAAAPVPTFGLLGDWQVVTPARVEVGYDRGATLAELNAPLQAERRYFFMNAEAGFQLVNKSMDLTSTEGQRATLIVDFAQPLFYIDGQVTLHTDGQMAFIREALGPIGDSNWFPTDLPLRQTVLVHLQGQVGRGVEPKLTVAGEYRMDGGLVGKWLQIDATPLLAQGQAIIGPQGLMLQGTARSALQPDQLFDGGAQAKLFVPFDAPEGSSLSVGADVSAPALNIEQEADATVQGQPGWLARKSEAAWSGVQEGWAQAGGAIQNGYDWVTDGIGTSVWVAAEEWCLWAGDCADQAAQSANNGTRVAEAK